MKRELIIENGEVFLNGGRYSGGNEAEVRDIINKIFRSDLVGWK